MYFFLATFNREASIKKALKLPLDYYHLKLSAATTPLFTGGENSNGNLFINVNTGLIKIYRFLDVILEPVIERNQSTTVLIPPTYTQLLFHITNMYYFFYKGHEV